MKTKTCKTCPPKPLLRRRIGTVLVTVLIFTGIISVLLMPFFISKTIDEYRLGKRKTALKEAFHQADSGADFAVTYIAMHEPAVPDSHTAVEFAKTDLPDLPGIDSVRIEKTALENVYLLTSRATVHNVTKTIEAKVRYNPPAHIFDYAIFTNNHFTFNPGNEYNIQGDIRVNGNLWNNGNPFINGDIFAHLNITNGDKIRGRGGQIINQHPGVDALNLPNLYNLDYYKNLADEKDGSITIGGSTIVNEVYTGNLYLEGTDANPITINGLVVIEGNVIVSGKITGQGAIYANGNLYIPVPLEYANGPESPRPSEEGLQAKNDWVDANKDKDLVAFCSSENILLGDVTDNKFVSLWETFTYYGDESHLGEDGIPFTEDDYIPYDHDDDPNTPDTTWYDVDKDGVMDYSYGTYESVNLDSAKLDTYANYPRDASDNPILYSDIIGTAKIEEIEGIYYTNHMLAGLTGSNQLRINGSFFAKTFALVYATSTHKIEVNYDERIHGRYNADGKRYKDLGLPIAETARVVSLYWKEL